MGAVIARHADDEWIPVEDASAPGRVRREAMQQAARLGFSEHRAGEVGIAATELATNLHRHAKRGLMLVRVCRETEEGGLLMVAVDSGPGMKDFAHIARDGESSKGTLGIGLGAVMRLASWYDVHSSLEHGSVIAAGFWDGRAPAFRPAAAGFTRAMTGETACGDAWASHVQDGRVTVLLADGLGHGELAAAASREAVRTFLSGTLETDLTLTLQRLNAALRSTRGAAAAIVSADRAGETLTFAGIGNVAVWIDDGERRHALASTPGIVGANTKKIRALQVPLAPHARVVMHSDGLTSKWNLAAYPGLRVRDAHLIAATLLRDAGTHHDDASIVVI
ncbi:MAG TPA: SpoIIE family protein phosphatase [Candidatus Baltobacteraceae bacterium]|nr:SpoIIE family protein phosphatase [Candidatus Baltobacteraceae bacterium]